MEPVPAHQRDHPGQRRRRVVGAGVRPTPCCWWRAASRRGGCRPASSTARCSSSWRRRGTTAPSPTCPGAARRTTCRPRVPPCRSSGPMDIEVSADAVRLPAGLGFDPGGIGKGLAADLVSDELVRAGADGVCVNLGGDLRVRGEAPDGRGLDRVHRSPRPSRADRAGGAGRWGGGDVHHAPPPMGRRRRRAAPPHRSAHGHAVLHRPRAGGRRRRLGVDGRGARQGRPAPRRPPSLRSRRRHRRPRARRRPRRPCDRERRPRRSPRWPDAA